MTDKKPKARSKPLLRTDAYEEVLTAIILGDLEPGTQINEKQLMQEFKIKQAAVRDALFRLSLEGLVERQPRIGTRVADLGLRELQELFEARVLIEVHAAQMAISRASRADLDNIRASYDGHEKVIDTRNFRAFLKMDRQFHNRLAISCKNRQIERMMLSLHNNASRFWCFGIQRLDNDTLKAQTREHLAIVDAIERKDGMEVERLTRMALGRYPDERFMMIEPIQRSRRERVEP